MRKLGTVMAFAMILSFTGGAFAQTYHNRQANINKRQARQARRIEKGVENGSLTARETQQLSRQEARISDLEAKDRASGGRLSTRERAELNRLLNTESGRIYRQEHDNQGRNPNSYNINQRQANQTNRIQEGVEKGNLTPRETQRLTAQEARIADLEVRDRASGGRLSRQERAELNRLLNTESGRIYRQKHDGQGTRP
jgi:CRISPR/Cas system-associated endoribonuclease Cas2